MKNIFAVALIFLSGTLFASPGMMDVSRLPDRFAKADVAFLDRVNSGKAIEALELYRAIYSRIPKDSEAAWRVSMACYFVGFNISRNKDERIKLFAEGRDAGLAAAEYNPISTEAHFWAAVNMALYGQEVGVLKMLFTLGAIKEHLEKSLELDPKYAYGGASRILGKIDESLPEVLGGSKERARRYYEKAIGYAPDEPLNYLFLARILKEHFKDKPRAIKVASAGLDCKIEEPYRFESFEALRLLKEFLGDAGTVPEKYLKN